MKQLTILATAKNIFCILFTLLTFSSYAQTPNAPSNLKELGTRTWIRLNWTDNASNEQGYKIYWATTNSKPSNPNATIAANATKYFITPVTELTTYYVWVEAYNASGSSSSITGNVTTIKNWVLDSNEATNLSIPSSAAVPAGMQLFWQDEFNDDLLNRNKWSTNYYSLADGPLWNVEVNSRPQPIMNFDGSSLVLLGDGIISSIQTYDWGTNENFLDNSRGGYFEVRVRRNKLDPSGQDPNTAFWLDAPGPDVKRYMETGNTAFGVTGIRPHGQAFEIDVFELLTAQFVIHGRVSPTGAFEGNLTTHIAEGYTHVNNWVTHGVLWGPGIVSHYINGNLIKTYSDKNAMYSPNHFMNVLLGAYVNGKMEVDYVRGYQWPLTGGNELPNGGAEYSNQLLPWEGNATVSNSIKRSGNNGFVLAAGQTLSQYVYLDNSNNYQLKYWVNGSGTIEAMVENITQVTGTSEDTYLSTPAVSSTFTQYTLDFKAGTEYGDHMKTVKLTFTNTGTGSITLDDIEFQKGGTGGSALYCTAAGGTNATDRYITSLSTTTAVHNISYTNNAYPTNGYGYFTSDSIVATQGTSFTLNMTSSPNTKWSRVKVYADWNGNNNFTDAGDTILSVGNANQDNSATVLNISSSIAVPATATLGKIRMRVRFYDAWNTDPGPCGQVDFTTTQDFIVNISAAQITYCTASGGTHATDRYITSLSTTNAVHNISYTNNAYPTNGYGYFISDSIVATQGTSFTLNMTNSPNTKWSRVKVYADWNGNGNFTDAGDAILSVGNANQDNSATVLNISSSIAVPATATSGKTRMRVRFYDAWNTDPGSCGQADYTTTQDFVVKILSSSGLRTMHNTPNFSLVQPYDPIDGADKNLNVYPNPTKNSFDISLYSDQPGQGEVKMEDLKGSVVYRANVFVNKGKNIIKVKKTGLAAGLYIVRINSGLKTYSKKVIIQ